MKYLPNLYPFIFARLTDGCLKEIKQHGGLGTSEVKDWLVVIAQPDFKLYDSRWMASKEQGDYCLVPDVDLTFEKDQLFATFDEAKRYVGSLWVKQMGALEPD